VVFGKVEVGFASLAALLGPVAAGGRREDPVRGRLSEIEIDDGTWPLSGAISRRGRGWSRSTCGSTAGPPPAPGPALNVRRARAAPVGAARSRRDAVPPRPSCGASP
jgi:hypothetical protein